MNYLRSLQAIVIGCGCGFCLCFCFVSAACSGGDSRQESCANESLSQLPATDAFQEGDSQPHGQLDAVTLFEIGLRHMREGHPQAAVEHFDRALALEVGNPRLYDARSSALFALGKLAEALKSSEAAVMLLPKDPGLHVNRGLLYVEFGRKEEAFTDYALALALHPGYAPAYYNRGVLNFQEGLNQAALADFRAAIAAQPELANPYFNRAMVQEALCDIDAAKADMLLFLERAHSEDHQNLAHSLLRRWSAEQQETAAKLAFEELVARCKMEFIIPPGFSFGPGLARPGLDCEATLQSDVGDLQVRLALRCLADAQLDYQDPHSSKPAPEHIYPLLYTAIVQEIATDPHSASGGFGENSLAEFDADWGQMSLLTPKDDFCAEFQSMLFVAIHRRAAADAYLVFLFDDYKLVKDKIKFAMGSLRFSDD